MPGQSLASVFNKRLAGGGAKLPKASVGDAANVLLQGFRRALPAVFSTGIGPKIVGFRRVLARHVNSVSHMSDGYFICWPSGKKRLKELPADFPAQATHAIHERFNMAYLAVRGSGAADESFGFWRPRASKSWSVMPSFCSA